MCTLQPVARFPFLFSYLFFKIKSHKQISSRDNSICGGQTGPRVHNNFLWYVNFWMLEVQFLCIEPIGNIWGLVSLKWNMTLCEIWIENYIGLYIIVQKYI